ncbi:MAG: HAMP domain-containing histidine kinase [Deltaproteobacteria bacterium]|nr:HAMP domain-containing histidine kinase [Deltaproteobacteria bacterium]
MSPKRLYLLAGLALAVAFFAVVYLSRITLRQDRARQEARQAAEAEENVRLGLWRLDSEMAALIAAENARPYFDYGAFYALDRTYAEMVDGAAQSAQRVPSPLLLAMPPGIQLHFQLEPEGRLSSPQVPVGALHEKALKVVGQEQLGPYAQRLAKLAQRFGPGALDELRGDWQRQQAEAEPILDNNNAPQGSAAFVQNVKNAVELSQRAKSVRRASNYNPSYEGVEQQIKEVVVARAVPVPEGAMVPIWRDGELFLVRSVRVGERRLLQGCWLDWAQLSLQLKAAVVDILPGAQLRPAGPQDRRSSRILASLPVILEPGPPLLVPYDDEAVGVWLALAVAWSGVLLSTVAVLALLFGAVSLGERRAVFVSAVTHELRTPLTTFRMYADMLADGMVKDPHKAQRYLETLRREAVRLGHLVENVLAYSRIERGRASAPPETIDTQTLFQRFASRLADRAAEAKMELVVEPGSARVHVDVSAVEQILFNLVDNAGKYAQGATDRRIHLVAEDHGRKVLITISDHGPGISREDRRGLFSPFSKSAQRAALSAPGVGLGLALSRRLAEAMGGRLDYAGSEAGARFVLTLPAA